MIGILASRRRRQPDAQLLGVLGSQLTGWYDTRFVASVTQSANAVSSWADARGAIGFAPALVQATGGSQPTWSGSAQTITFDGTDDFLRSTDAGWNTITAAHALVLICTAPTTGGVIVERIAESSTSGGVSALLVRREISNGQMLFIADGSIATGRNAPTGRGVFHGARSAISGGNITVTGRVNTGAATSVSAAGSDRTVNRITLGTDRADSPTLFADTVVRALLVIKGAYSTEQQDAVNAWALKVHAVGA